MEQSSRTGAQAISQPLLGRAGETQEAVLSITLFDFDGVMGARLLEHEVLGMIKHIQKELPDLYPSRPHTLFAQQGHGGSQPQQPNLNQYLMQQVNAYLLRMLGLDATEPKGLPKELIGIITGFFYTFVEHTLTAINGAQANEIGCSFLKKKMINTLDFNLFKTF